MVQRPRPLRSDRKRRYLRKKRNVSELEVDPLPPEVEVNKDVFVESTKTSIKLAQKENDDSGRETALLRAIRHGLRVE